MAKILYGVAGEGFGHSSRSELIGRRLLERGHEVMFAASGKSLAYLTQPFEDRVHEVYGLRFVYRDGKVHAFYTVLDNMVNYRRGFPLNRNLFKTRVEPFRPDLVISDFEPYSAWWAWRNRVPCVFADHEHLLTLAKLRNVPGLIDRIKAHVVTLGYHTFAQAYVILNFFRAPLRSGRGVMVNPVVRPCVMGLSVSQGQHIVVYSTDSKPQTRQKYISIFSQMAPRPFYIYGFNVDQQHGNCIFKKTSTEGFLGDLAGCAGVVATAGFSLVSECLYLRKRMLLAPVKGQFEQQVNAVYADRLGFARHIENLDSKCVGLFFDDLDKEFPNHEQILWPDNEAFFETFDATLNQQGFSLGLSEQRAVSE